jgi:hypothetical protein
VAYFPGRAESVFSEDQFRSQKIRSDSAQFNIVFAGNVGVSQAFLTVLKAMEFLKDDEKICWTIVGDGRMYDWLVSEIGKRGMGNIVRLAGRHPMEGMNLKEDFISMHLTTPYQINKMNGEMYANFYFHHYGLKIVNCRFFNLFGHRGTWTV